MVNAPIVARDRGIRVSEVRRAESESYHTAIRVSVTTAKMSRSVAGTLFAETKPRLVQIKGIDLEAELGPNMLYVTNRDKPGFIGALGSTLGAAGINIATFHLGRAEAGGDAICLVAVDQPIPAEILAKICALESVVQAKALGFRT
jgi:D-3-phosphoglycerate dehydrogenase